VVADGLSKKIVQMFSIMIKELELVEQFRDLSLNMEFVVINISSSRLTISCDFLKRVQKRQLLDSSLKRTMTLIGAERTRDFVMD